MYKWEAIYNNGEALEQFNPVNKEERLFKDINQEELSRFKIKDDNNNVIVDLKNGTFHLNNNHIEIQDFSNLDVEYRLVYFRRVQKVMSTRGEVLNTTTVSYIGYQVTIDGVNHIRMLACDGDKITFVTKK